MLHAMRLHVAFVHLQHADTLPAGCRHFRLNLVFDFLGPKKLGVKMLAFDDSQIVWCFLHPHLVFSCHFSSSVREYSVF